MVSRRSYFLSMQRSWVFLILNVEILICDYIILTLTEKYPRKQFLNFFHTMMDDFFDNFTPAPQSTTFTPSEPLYQPPVVEQPFPSDNIQDLYGRIGSSSSPTKFTGESFVSAEQLQRREKLRHLEEERLKQVREKEEQERVEKQQRQLRAQQFLRDWTSSRQQQIAHKAASNREKQVLLAEARKNQNEYRNSWDKVASNISLKDGEYPGKKDVSKMRQAILNKKLDLK